MGTGRNVTRKRKSKCVVCGRGELYPNELSATGKCPECFQLAMKLNNTQISEHRGPYFERWRERMAASVGGVIPQKGTSTLDSPENRA